MAIQITKRDDIQPLLQAEPPSPVGVPLSEPASLVKSVQMQIPGKEHIDTGFWECTPGQFRREVMAGEVMHILCGHCTFTPEQGEPITLRGGDTTFFPPNTRGIWNVQETVRKVYVLL